MTRLAEPEWDQASRGIAMALDDVEALMCPSCGRPKAICQDPANQDQWRVGAPIRCHPTTAVHAAQERFQKQYGDSGGSIQALSWPVTLEGGGTGG